MSGASKRIPIAVMRANSVRIELPFHAGVKRIESVVLGHERPIVGDLVFDGVGLFAVLRDFLARTNCQPIGAAFAPAQLRNQALSDEHRHATGALLSRVNGFALWRLT